MTTEISQEGDAQPIESAGESETPVEIETIAIPKTDYEKLNQTLGSLKREIKDLKKPKDEPKETSTTNKQNGLDETQLDYLDLKGISEADDVKVVEDIVKKTGMTVRQALKDEYVVAKLNSNKAQREVKDATPSATKRGGNQQTDIASAIAKFESSGQLPNDYALRTAVVNAIADKANTNKPSWHH